MLPSVTRSGSAVRHGRSDSKQSFSPGLFNEGSAPSFRPFDQVLRIPKSRHRRQTRACGQTGVGRVHHGGTRDSFQATASSGARRDVSTRSLTTRSASGQGTRGLKRDQAGIFHFSAGGPTALCDRPVVVDPHVDVQTTKAVVVAHNTLPIPNFWSFSSSVQCPQADRRRRSPTLSLQAAASSSKSRAARIPWA